MTYKDASYWHTKGKFVKENPTEILATIVGSDNNISRTISLRAQRDLKAFDESLAFFIELLQILYKRKEIWNGNLQAKASIAMANSALNYHLIGRHAVLLGYGSEAHMLYRGCFERMTRAIVFQVNESFALRFWKGDQISQSEVNEKISRYLESKNDKPVFDEIYKSYKNNWKMLSELSHPNRETIAFRILTIEGISFNESIGINVALGGMSNESIISGIIGSTTHVTFSLSLMRILVGEFFGNWNKKLDKKLARLMEAGMEVSVSELERQVDLLEGHRPYIK